MVLLLKLTGVEIHFIFRNRGGWKEVCVCLCIGKTGNISIFLRAFNELINPCKAGVKESHIVVVRSFTVGACMLRVEGNASLCFWQYLCSVKWKAQLFVFLSTFAYATYGLVEDIWKKASQYYQPSVLTVYAETGSLPFWFDCHFS